MPWAMQSNDIINIDRWLCVRLALSHILDLGDEIGWSHWPPPPQHFAFGTLASKYENDFLLAMLSEGCPTDVMITIFTRCKFVTTKLQWHAVCNGFFQDPLHMTNPVQWQFIFNVVDLTELDATLFQAWLKQIIATYACMDILRALVDRVFPRCLCETAIFTNAPRYAWTQLFESPGDMFEYAQKMVLNSSGYERPKALQVFTLLEETRRESNAWVRDSQWRVMGALVDLFGIPTPVTKIVTAYM